MLSASTNSGVNLPTAPKTASATTTPGSELLTPANFTVNPAFTSRVVGTVSGLTSASSFPVAAGHTITIGDGTGTATVTSAGNVTVQSILTAINTAGLKLTAFVNNINGQIQIEVDNIAGHDRGKVTAIEITQNSASPQLKLNFVYPDGTPVAGTLNYTMATSALKLGGNTPLTNGEATCVLFSNPSAMGLSGQITLTLSLTDSTGKTLWQIAMTMDPTSVNFGAVQSSTLNVVVQKT